MQIIHDFRQVFLCLILSCYILKMNALGGRDIDLGLIAAHAEHHGVASGPLHEFSTEILANGKKDQQWQNPSHEEADDGRHFFLDVL